MTGRSRSPPGSRKLSRGNAFVVAAVIVALPFLHRPVALPVAARLWRKGDPAKTELARELTGLIAAAPARRGRAVHVVADGACICSQLRSLPPGVTLTGPLPRHATLYGIHPELDYPPLRRGRRGRPYARTSAQCRSRPWPSRCGRSVLSAGYHVEERPTCNRQSRLQAVDDSPVRSPYPVSRSVTRPAVHLTSSAAGSGERDRVVAADRPAADH